MKKKLLKCIMTGCLVAAVFWGTACTKPADVEQTPRASSPEGTREQQVSSGEAGQAQLQDFFMPVKETVKLSGAEFENVALAAEQYGYDFKAPESFSNGYEFIWLDVEEAMSSITLTYEKNGVQTEFCITPKGKPTGRDMRVIEEKEVAGVNLTTGLYIHFEMPLNWEELITEEQQELLDKGWADGGVDSVPKEIIRHDIYEFLWQDTNQEFCLSSNLLHDVKREDMELIAAEWIEFNAD